MGSKVPLGATAEIAGSFARLATKTLLNSAIDPRFARGHGDGGSPQIYGYRYKMGTGPEALVVATGSMSGCAFLAASSAVLTAACRWRMETVFAERVIWKLLSWNK